MVLAQTWLLYFKYFSFLCRRLTTVRKWFDDNGYDSNTIWDEIYDTIIKTLISAHPILRHNYRTCFSNQTNVKGSSCFEVLGFDVMLDRKLRAWILEVRLAILRLFLQNFVALLGGFSKI